MGRHKLPNHLLLSPPPTPPTASHPFASSLLSVKSAVSQTSSIPGFQDSYGPGTVGDKIPGFKTSAAFFTTLRANLAIELESPPPSLCNTPDLRPITMASSTASLPPPSPSPLAQVEDASAADALDVPSNSPPPLTTRIATSEDDKVEVLHLVADSVAQQRQYASVAILYHPISVAAAVLIFGLLYQWLYKGRSSDWALLMTTFAGVGMSALVGIRLLTKGYIEEAESVGTWKWLEKDRDSTEVIGDDELFLSRYGNQAIGALILRGVRNIPSNGTSNNNGGSQRKRRQNSKDKNAPILGQIRGWTVKNKYRRKGVGAELLEEAIKICQQRGWQGPEIDPEHANSKRHLPALFCGPFEKRDAQARSLLEATKDAMGVGSTTGNGSGKKRR